MEAFVHAYFALAIGYNLASLVRADWRGKGLAPTDPVPAITLMVAFYLSYAARPLLDPIAWHTLILIFTALIARFGVVTHLVGYDRQGYASTLARMAAAAINAFGVLVFLAVLWP